MSSAEQIEPYEDEVVQFDLDDEGRDAEAQDSVRLYLNLIGKTPLLGAVEEVELSQRIEAGVFAETVRDVRNPETRDGTLAATERNLKSKQEIDLLAKLALTEVEVVDEKGKTVVDEAGKPVLDYELPDKDLDLLIKDGAKAKEHLFEANLRLVVNIAKRYTGHGVAFLDLIQEGNIGLKRAVEKFDYTKGFKFSTYSTWWIRQAISRGMADQGRTIRIPMHMMEQVNKLGKVERELLRDLGREATPEELAKETGMKLDRVEELKQIRREPISLDMPVGDMEGSRLADFLTEETKVSPVEDAIDFAEMVKGLHGLLGSTLNPREAQIIKMRYGIEDGVPQTLDQISIRFALSRERIRQLEGVAMKKLRESDLTTQMLAGHLDNGVGAIRPKKLRRQ